jgi:hypothetical protein
VDPTPLWLGVAAVMALGGAIMLLFGFALRYGRRVAPTASAMWRPGHG